MTTPFFVIQPQVINEDKLIASNVPENDHPVFDPATTYSIGDRVIVTTGHHKVYQSLTNTNLGFFPPENPARWVEVGPTNVYAAFDVATGTVTTNPNEVVFLIMANRPQAIALLELVATHVRVEVFRNVPDPAFSLDFANNSYRINDGPLPLSEIDLSIAIPVFDTGLVKMQDRSVITNHYDYAFVDIDLQTDYVLDELPVFGDCAYRITVKNPGAIAQVGNIVIGKRYRFGFTQYGATLGIIDSSRKDTDQFGRTTIVPRKFRKRMSVTVVMEPTVTDGVARKLSELRATPALYCAAKDIYESLNVYGFPRDWSVDIAFPTQTAGSFEIEGI